MGTPKEIQTPPQIGAFEDVGLEEFYDAEELKKRNEYSTELVVLTEKERILVNLLIDHLKTLSPETLEVITDRVADFEQLAKNIAHFPSLLEKHDISHEYKTPLMLIDTLVKNFASGSDRTLYLPTKALLGRGFLFAKFQVFISMTKMARDFHFSQSDVAEFQKVTTSLMFTIMAEDVYLSLLDNKSIPLDLRQEVAMALIVLWEHRTDKNVADMAPVLEAVWNARSKLAPAFGTMVGTSELLLMSIEMDDTWRRFIAKRAGDPAVSLALEEFLFGLSYEDIQRVKGILRERGIAAIDRHEVAAFLDREDELEHNTDETDPRSFYMTYSFRRDNAKARLRLNVPGPHHTLEDYYMQFMLEESKEKEQTDAHTE